MAAPIVTAIQDEWLWGWDPTPGIVSLWAEDDGRVVVWRRDPDTGVLIKEVERFRPWLLLDRLDDLLHLGDTLCQGDGANARITYRELDGPGALRYLVSADDYKTLTRAILLGATRRLCRNVEHIKDLGAESVLSVPTDEQYLVATGRNYFRDLSFDSLHRLQFDLETTGLFAEHDRIFMVSVRHADGRTEVLEAKGKGDAGEADLIRRLITTVRAADPDVIENHNLHGFDLPFLYQRARRLGVPLTLGRPGAPGLRRRAARRGVKSEDDEERRVRFVA